MYGDMGDNFAVKGFSAAIGTVRFRQAAREIRRYTPGYHRQRSPGFFR